jgi:hypothetical protein
VIENASLLSFTLPNATTGETTGRIDSEKTDDLNRPETYYIWVFKALSQSKSETTSSGRKNDRPYGEY